MRREWWGVHRTQLQRVWHRYQIVEGVPGVMRPQAAEGDTEETEPLGEQTQQAQETHVDGLEKNTTGGENENVPASGKEVEVFKSWSNELEDKLIDKHRAAAHLWDKLAAGYKTKNKLEIAQKAWSEEMHIPGEQIQRRIKRK